MQNGENILIPVRTWVQDIDVIAPNFKRRSIRCYIYYCSTGPGQSKAVNIRAVGPVLPRQYADEIL